MRYLLLRVTVLLLGDPVVVATIVTPNLAQTSRDRAPNMGRQIRISKVARTSNAFFRRKLRRIRMKRALYLPLILFFASAMAAETRRWNDTLRDVYAGPKLDRSIQTLSTTK